MSGPRVPDPRHMVHAYRNDALPIRSETRVLHRLLMARRRARGLPRWRVPDARRAVTRSGDDAFAGRTESGRVDWPAMPERFTPRFAAAGLPYLRGAVLRSSQYPLAVRAELGAAHGALVRHPGERFARARVPHSRCGIVRGSDDQP